MDHSPESLSGGEDVYHKSPTLKSILGITQSITKANQVTKFNRIILTCTISMSDLLSNQKGQECVYNQTFWLQNSICNITFFRFFDLLTPYRGRGCVKG